MKWTLLLVTCLVGAAMLLQLPGRGIDPDELEHIHAACAVSWGEVPYRDFFEHHGPALYYLLQPILRLTGPELPVLWCSRLLMWAIGMATLAVTAAMAYRLSGKMAAAPALLACTTIFFQKAIEVRPDVPAMLLLTVATYAVIAGGMRRSAFAAVLVGLILGLATLFTQKAIVPAAAIGLVAAAVDRNIGKWGLAVAAAGVVWLVAAGLFWTVGGAEAFLDSTLWQLWLWPVGHSPLSTLRPTLASDIPLWIAAAAAVIVSIRMLGRRFQGPESGPLPNNREKTILSLTVLLCFAGGLLAKAAYAQYYLLWFPLAAVVATDELIGWAGGDMTGGARRTFFGVLAILLAVEAALAVRSVCRGASGSVPHLTGWASTLDVTLIYGGVLIALAATTCICIVRGRRAGTVLSLAAIALAYADLRNLDALCWSNRRQTAAIEQVCRLVGPNETVFDGYTGLGALRRHAYYYWWLNPYSLKLMPPGRADRDLLAVLKRSPPKIVCLDENIRGLPADVVTWIERHYAPLEPPLYVRKRQ